MKKNAVTVLASAWVAVMLVLASPALAADKDNNPPGSAGGKGTNWENPPGPEGGRGASPDKKHYGLKKKADRNNDGVVDQAEQEMADKIKARRKDKADTNDDGVVDEAEKAQAKAIRAEKKEPVKEKADINGDGTVDKTERREAKQAFLEKHDRDNNPPGPKGGKGTNWENPPGPQGGAGASPDRRHKD